jgi:hypothetical protein
MAVLLAGLADAASLIRHGIAQRRRKCSAYGHGGHRGVYPEGERRKLSIRTGAVPAGKGKVIPLARLAEAGSLPDPMNGNALATPAAAKRAWSA